jgi:hypothetical protein
MLLFSYKSKLCLLFKERLKDNRKDFKIGEECDDREYESGGDYFQIRCKYVIHHKVDECG